MSVSLQSRLRRVAGHHRVDIPPALLFGRMRTRRRTIVILALALGASALLRGSTIPVPFLTGDERIALAPLLPVVPGVFVAALCGNHLAVQEHLAGGRRLLLLRLAWAVLVLATLTAAEELVEGVRDWTAASMVLASCLSFMGLGMAGAAVGSASASWLAPGCLALLMLTLGTKLDDSVRWWAWLLRRPAPGCWVVTICLALAGLLAYVVLPSLAV